MFSLYAKILSGMFVTVIGGSLSLRQEEYTQSVIQEAKSSKGDLQDVAFSSIMSTPYCPLLQPIGIQRLICSPISDESTVTLATLAPNPMSDALLRIKCRVNGHSARLSENGNVLDLCVTPEYFHDLSFLSLKEQEVTEKFNNVVGLQNSYSKKNEENTWKSFSCTSGSGKTFNI